MEAWTDFRARAHTQLSAPASSPLVLGFATVGLLVLGARVWSFNRLLWSLFALPGKRLRTFGPKGSWALVTGASDGIGLEYARQLARAGFSIALVARTPSKLHAAAQELEKTHKARTATFAIDFANASTTDWAALEGFIGGLTVEDDADTTRSSSAGITTRAKAITDDQDEHDGPAILINNVGLSHSIPVPFAETSAAERDAIIAINCAATLRVTAAALPGMLRRRNGLILTVGSFAGLIPTPLLATYSGSKAFLQHWSSALASELAPRGITVELVQSYLVTGAMSKIRRPSAMIPSPKTFVRTSLNQIGRSGGAQDFVGTNTPYPTHALLQWLIRTFTGSFTGWIPVSVNKRMHEDIRRRALRKQARDAGKKTS